jgi:Actin
MLLLLLSLCACRVSTQLYRLCHWKQSRTICNAVCMCVNVSTSSPSLPAVCERVLLPLPHCPEAHSADPCAHITIITPPVAAVHDGYVLTKSVSRSPVGGRLLNDAMRCALGELMAKEGSGAAQLRPRNTFKRIGRSSKGAGDAWEV